MIAAEQFSRKLLYFLGNPAGFKDGVYSPFWCEEIRALRTWLERLMVKGVSTFPTRDIQYLCVRFQSRDKFQEICFFPWLPRADDSPSWIKSNFISEDLALAAGCRQPLNP